LPGPDPDFQELAMGGFRAALFVFTAPITKTKKPPDFSGGV
jgi:hypothetical protein